MTHKTDDQKLHELRGEGFCWHEGVTRNWIETLGTYVEQCPKCGIAVDKFYDGLGDPIGYNPRYSTSLDAVMPVVEEMRGKGWLVSMTTDQDCGWLVHACSDVTYYTITDASLPTAMTKALIAAMEERRDERN